MQSDSLTSSLLWHLLSPYDWQVSLIAGRTISPWPRVKPLTRSIRRRRWVWIQVSSPGPEILNLVRFLSMSCLCLFPLYSFCDRQFASLNRARSDIFPVLNSHLSPRPRQQGIYLITKMEWHAIYVPLIGISPLESLLITTDSILFKGVNTEEFFTYLISNVLS